MATKVKLEDALVEPMSCRLVPQEMGCMYCGQVIPRSTLHRTCPTCRAKWAAVVGPLWYLEEFHVTELKEHKEFYNAERAPRTSQKRQRVVDSNTTDIDPAEVTEPLPREMVLYGLDADGYQAFMAIKDLLLIEAAVKRTVAANENEVLLARIQRHPVLAKMARGRYGRVVIAAELSRQGIPVPGVATIHRYMKLIREEITACPMSDNGILSDIGQTEKLAA